MKNLPLAMTLFLWLCLCHTVCVISTQICRFCRNPSERNYTGIWAEKCSLCSAKFPAAPGNLNTQHTRVSIQGVKSLWGIALFFRDWAPVTLTGGAQTKVPNTGKTLQSPQSNLTPWTLTLDAVIFKHLLQHI